MSVAAAAVVLALRVSAQACDAPASAVRVVEGDAPVVVVLSHAGEKRPVSCDTHAPAPRRSCTADHDVVCASGPCRVYNDKGLRVLGENFAAHLGVCLGARPTVVVAEVKREIVDVGRDAGDAPGCAVEGEGARAYWDAFYAALDGAIARAKARGGDRALLVDVHTYRTLDAAPAPAVILGGGRPFGATATHLPPDLVFGAHGLRAALLDELGRSFPGLEVWPRDPRELDDDLFVGRHLLSWAGARVDALQLELSEGPRDEPALAGYLAARAFCDALAERVVAKEP
jgi:hypothetical protein